jgi:pimeloyl-ACP methyl ester carboxylesterase
MKKKLFIVVGIIIVVGIGFIAREIRYAHYPVTIPASEEWDPYITSLDAERELHMVETNDGTKIEALLFIPDGGSEQKAAVVWTGGSADGAYHNYAWGLIETYVLDVFLSRDMAVILTNKRGVGASEGNWAHVGVEGRASDIVAVVQMAQEHPVIDASNVGLIGHSQGGWVVTNAAANYDDIAFIISLAGPTTSVRTNVEDNAYHIYRCEGYTGDELQKKIAQKMKMAEVGVTLGNITHFGMLHQTALLLEYDPAVDLLSLQTPGLFIYGENDDQVTPQWSLNRLDELFDGNPPEHFTTVVLDDATHAFRLVDDPCESWVNVPEQPRSEELTVVLNDWLEIQGY